MRTTAIAVLTMGVLVALPACAPEPAPATAAEFTLTSPDLDEEGYLPDWAIGRAPGFCDGENRSPNLEWTGSPSGTMGFALTMTDPAFPSYVHWIVTGIAAEDGALASSKDGALEDGVVGMAGAGAGEYVGPCVADNGYVYTLYALDSPVVGDGGTTLVDLSSLMSGHVLDEATLEVKRR